MKILISFLILFLSFSYSSAQQKEIWIPIQYHYPFNKVGKGKTKVYQNLKTAEQVFSDVHTQIVFNKRYLYSTQYALDKKIDSSVFVNDKLIENYGFYNGRIIRREIKEDTIIDNGKKYGQHVFNMIEKTNDIIHFINRTEEYIKDTSLNWQGKELDCIVIKAINIEVFQSKNNPSSKQERKINYIFYHAKGIGLVKFIRNDTNEASTWVLKAIREIKH